LAAIVQDSSLARLRTVGNGEVREMLTILLIVVIVLLLTGGIGYGRRGR
jgi:hypothetical protein